MKVSALLHESLEYFARIDPDSEFGFQSGRRISYGEADRLANRFGGALLAAGLGIGDRIGYLSRNSIEMALMYLGASKVGVVPVPLNYRLAPAEWAWILRDSRARLLFSQRRYAPGVDSMRSDLALDGPPIAIDGSHGGWIAMPDWLGAVPETKPPREPLPTDILYQMYTSGTTGRPKGAMLSHENVVTNAFQCLAVLGSLCRPGERILVVMPMHHAGATSFVVGAVLCGGAMVFQEDFVPAEFLRALEQERIVAANVVPAMIQAALGLPRGRSTGRDRFPDLRCLIYGAAPIAESTLRAGLALFYCEVYLGFGQTLSSAALTFLTAADHRRALAGRPELLLSAGRALPSTEIAIVDEAGRFLPPGSVGEVVARGPQVMQGYWGLPEQSALALSGGWLHTGDAGMLDDNGYLYIRDRIKDMIVSGGENVYPREVENVLFECPGIAEAAVIGVPDERYGEALLAVVVSRDGVTLVADEIVAFCRGRLAGFKIPRRFSFVAELPRHPSGKVLKRVLREAYWSGHQRRVS